MEYMCPINRVNIVEIGWIDCNAIDGQRPGIGDQLRQCCRWRCGSQEYLSSSASVNEIGVADSACGAAIHKCLMAQTVVGGEGGS
jgi:hypothetical protein